MIAPLRTFVALLALGMAGAPRPALAEPPVVYKSPTCQCCEKWMAHMKDAGIALEPRNVTQSQLTRLKASLGLKPEQASCHTAMIEGYVVEGHVPAGDVERLIAEKPEAIGLAVPGMPIGSPGMEHGDTKQPYDVLLVKKDGSSEVWSRH